MRKILVAFALAASLPAAAQPMMALGKPLSSSDLDPGVVTVRLIAGKPSSPVIGANVTLVVNGAPRQARTDSGGRATFKDLPVGATIVAKATDDEKQEIVSEQFTVPSAGGMRVMLTTKPMSGGGGGGPEMGPGGAMPEPRKISGTPRAEQNYAEGTIQAIVTYNDLKGGLAPGVPIALVGYKSDDTVSLAVQATDANGRAEFANLDRTGNTEYFVLGQLPRGDGFDRLYATPTQLDKRGVHVILSGDKKDSKEPPTDDLPHVQAQSIPTEAGKLRVVVNGVPEFPAVMKVYDLATKQEVGHAEIKQVEMDGNAVSFQSTYTARADAPPGALGVMIAGGEPGKEKPLNQVAVDVIAADATDANAAVAIATANTEANGQVVHEKLPTDKKLRVRAKINGQLYVTDPFELATAGAVVEIMGTWGVKGRIEAVVDVPHVAGRVLYAECINRAHLYRSVPFQTMPTTGTQLSMYFYPRTLFTFMVGAIVEDQLLGVRGTFSVTNYSWAPYKAPGDGFIIPLPEHFKGAFVDEGDKDEASVETGVGFRILRPIAPGGRKFNGGFSLPADKGTLTWNQELPIGAYSSSIKILKTPGMQIGSPANLPIQEGEVDQGEIFQVAPITIMPNRAKTPQLELAIVGMPVLPAWRVWVPRILGIGVVLILAGGIAFALRRRDEGSADSDRRSREDQREKLLEELVALDRRSASDPDTDNERTRMRRETLITQLEDLWGDDA